VGLPLEGKTGLDKAKRVFEKAATPKESKAREDCLSLRIPPPSLKTAMSPDEGKRRPKEEERTGKFPRTARDQSCKPEKKKWGGC